MSRCWNEIRTYHLPDRAAEQIREGGDNGLFIIISKKFYINVVLFVGITTLMTLLNFVSLIYYVECLNVSTSTFNLQRGNFVYHY